MGMAEEHFGSCCHQLRVFRVQLSAGSKLAEHKTYRPVKHFACAGSHDHVVMYLDNSGSYELFLSTQCFWVPLIDHVSTFEPTAHANAFFIVSLHWHARSVAFSRPRLSSLLAFCYKPSAFSALKTESGFYHGTCVLLTRRRHPSSWPPLCCNVRRKVTLPRWYVLFSYCSLNTYHDTGYQGYRYVKQGAGTISLSESWPREILRVTALVPTAKSTAKGWARCMRSREARVGRCQRSSLAVAVYCSFIDDLSRKELRVQPHHV